MCFIKCYLEALGVIESEDEINKERAAMVYELDNIEVVDDCVKDISELRRQIIIQWFY